MSDLEELLKLEPREIYSFLLDQKIVYEESVGRRRHLEDYILVAEVEFISGKKYIEFPSAYSTGDMSADEKGWTFDKSLVREVHPEIQQITVYR